MSAEDKFLFAFQKFCFEFYERFMNAFADFKKKKYKIKAEHVRIRSDRDLSDANGFSYGVYHEGVRYFQHHLHECTPDHHPGIVLTDRGIPLKWQFKATPGEDHYILYVAVHTNDSMFEKNMGKALEKIMKQLKKEGLYEEFP